MSLQFKSKGSTAAVLTEDRPVAEQKFRFVTAIVIITTVRREQLEAFQSPATFANRDILRSSRFYFVLSKVVLAQEKEQESPKY